MRESSTYQAILAEGKAEGRAEGEARGKADGERKALLLSEANDSENPMS